MSFEKLNKEPKNSNLYKFSENESRNSRDKKTEESASSDSSKENVFNQDLKQKLRSAEINEATAAFLWHTGLVKNKNVEGITKLLNNSEFRKDFENAEHMNLEDAKKFLEDKYK